MKGCPFSLTDFSLISLRIPRRLWELESYVLLAHPVDIYIYIYIYLYIYTIYYILPIYFPYRSPIDPLIMFTRGQRFQRIHKPPWHKSKTSTGTETSAGTKTSTGTRPTLALITDFKGTQTSTGTQTSARDREREREREIERERRRKRLIYVYIYIYSLYIPCIFFIYSLYIPYENPLLIPRLLWELESRVLLAHPVDRGMATSMARSRSKAVLGTNFSELLWKLQIKLHMQHNSPLKGIGVTDLYIICYNNCYLYAIFNLFDKKAQILVGIGRGCPPTTPRHFWAIFRKNDLPLEILKYVRKIMKRPRAGKPILLLGDDENKKDAHRHDSNCHGPIISPSSIWSPIVKKQVLTKSVDCINNFSQTPPSPPPTPGGRRRRRRRRRRKNFPRAPKPHPPRTQGQHIP